MFSGPKDVITKTTVNMCCYETKCSHNPTCWNRGQLNAGSTAPAGTAITDPVKECIGTTNGVKYGLTRGSYLRESVFHAFNNTKWYSYVLSRGSLQQCRQAPWTPHSTGVFPV